MNQLNQGSPAVWYVPHDGMLKWPPKQLGQLKKEVGLGKKGAAHNSTINIIRFQRSENKSRTSSQGPSTWRPLAAAHGLTGFRVYLLRGSSHAWSCSRSLRDWAKSGPLTKGKQATHWAARPDSLLRHTAQGGHADGTPGVRSFV